MKIQGYKVDNFLSALPKGLRAALLYGPDIGLVSLRAEALGKAIVTDLKDPFRVAEISADRLEEDPALLADEVNAISFGGGRRLIRLRDADNGVAKALAAVLDAPTVAAEDAAFIVITAGDLPAKSSLRQLFETHKEAAALPCYQDDERNLATVVAQEFRKKGFTADRDAVSLIAENCQGDRMIAMSEIEKLALYMGEAKHIAYDDAAGCVGETTESSLQDVCNAVAYGRQSEVERHVRKSIAQGIAGAGVLRSVLYYFFRLYEIAGMMQQGLAADTAVESLRPPVFFKQQPVLRDHARIWGGQPQKLAAALELLRQAELDVKKTGADGDLITSRYLMQLANLPAKKAA